MSFDLYSSTPRDPQGIHRLIWDQMGELAFELPRGKDRVLAAYEVGEESAAYVEAIGVGEPLPAMPLFLAEGIHVKVPPEATFQAAWAVCPEDMQQAVESGILPQLE